MELSYLKNLNNLAPQDTQTPKIKLTSKVFIYLHQSCILVDRMQDAF